MDAAGSASLFEKTRLCKKELVWDCETRQKAKFPASYFEPAYSFRHLPPETFASQGAMLAPPQAMNLWRPLLAEFTGRQLSFPEDRLAAVSGVIAELKPVFQDECISGLWRRSFVRQLAWHRSFVYADVDDSARLKCAPGWSWASRTFKISLPSLEPEDAEDWTIRDDKVVLHRKLRKGYDIDAGPSSQWNVYHDFTKPDPEHKPYVSRFFLKHEGQAVFYFSLGRRPRYDSEEFTEITLAVVLTEHSGVFRRVGVVENNSGKSWFEGLQKEEIILI